MSVLIKANYKKEKRNENSSAFALRDFVINWSYLIGAIIVPTQKMWAKNVN